MSPILNKQQIPEHLLEQQNFFVALMAIICIVNIKQTKRQKKKINLTKQQSSNELNKKIFNCANVTSKNFKILEEFVFKKLVRSGESIQNLKKVIYFQEEKIKQDFFLKKKNNKK